MRLLLLIPTIVLFLSNVPFFKEVPMVVVEECLKQSSCDKAEMKHQCDEESQTDPSQNDDCCKKIETTCVCICCFQFAATVYRVGDQTALNNFLRSSYAGFLNNKYKDPELPSIYNPPDMV
jgi:hypothetical protein